MQNKFSLTKKEESSPFDEYKNKVDYEYVIEATLPIKFTSSEYDEPYPEQLEEAYEDIEEQLEALLTDEDYMKMDWEDVGLGRVYGKLVDFDDSQIVMQFGVSSKEADKPFTTQDLIDYAKEFMWVLNSNTDGVSISGVTIPGTIPDDNIDDSESLEPDYIHFEPTIKSSDEVKVKVIKEPTVKKESSISNNINIDKKLVNEGKLTFIKEDKNKTIILSDEGELIFYDNDELYNKLPFSKSGLQKECKSIITEGYKLKEQDIVDDKDLEATKQNLEKGIEKVDQLQDLKDEFINKVDNLVNESLDSNNIEFPSSEYTKQLIDPKNLDNLDLENTLTDEQINWITQNLCSLEELINGLYNLFGIIAIEEPVITLDNYINESYNLLKKKEDNKNV